MALNLAKWYDATNQVKYYNEVQEAYKREKEVRPILKYMKTTSTKNAKYATYYTSETLSATDYKPTWDRTPGTAASGAIVAKDNIVPAISGIAPENQKDIFMAHRMSFRKKEVPYWLLEDDTEQTEVDINTTVIHEQIRALVRAEEFDLLTMFKNLYNGTLTVWRAQNEEDITPSVIGVPAANIQGSAAAFLDTTANWGSFRDITVRAESMTDGRFAIITGFAGMSRILNTTKTESRDFYPNGNSVVTGKIGPQLFGGEIFVYPQFDSVFNVSAGVIPYIIVCIGAGAYDRPNGGMKAFYELNKQRQSYYFQATNKYNSTILDETGVFFLNTKY